MESKLVNKEFISDSKNYNIKLGGCGGWDVNNSIEGIASRLRSEKFLNWSKSGVLRLQELANIRKNNRPPRVRKPHGCINKYWICNVDLRKNTRIDKYSTLPEGWVRGKSLWNMKPKIQPHINSAWGRKNLKDSVETPKHIQSTNRGYRKKASVSEIETALRLYSGDIILAKISLGYSSKGNNSYLRFKRIWNNIQANINSFTDISSV